MLSIPTRWALKTSRAEVMGLSCSLIRFCRRSSASAGRLFLSALAAGLVCCLPASASTDAGSAQLFALVNELSTRPELMSLSYLQHVLGPPAEASAFRNGYSPVYHWYEEPSRFLHYELEQSGPNPGVVTAATFTINVPSSALTFKDVEHAFGHGHRVLFDQHSYPMRVYQATPSTRVSFVQPHDTFRVQQIRIAYAGAALPQTPEADLERAYRARYQYMMSRAANGEPHVAIPYLEQKVRLDPGDARSRLALADAYRQNLDINRAINTYKKALATANGDPAVVGRAVSALTELRAISTSTAAPAWR